MARHRSAALALLGTYPPPAGGVASEVLRLCPLMTARGIDYVVYNLVSDSGDGDRVLTVRGSRVLWLLYFALTTRARGIYFLTDRLPAWILAALMTRLRGKRVLVQLRNAKLQDWIASSPWRRAVGGWCLRNVTGVVCVSHALIDAARSVGVQPARAHWKPAFLPPPDDELARERAAPEVWPFLDAHHPVIAANGKVDFQDGEDLYGLDLLVDLAARLVPDYPELGIVICFWKYVPETDQSYLESLIARARERGVERNMLFSTAGGRFVPVVAESDLFVRPTNTDGDAVSVREALHLGKPSLASDAAARPEGTVVFRTRDIDDLEATVRAVLADPSPGEGRSGGDDGTLDRYLDLLEAMGQGREFSATRDP